MSNVARRSLEGGLIACAALALVVGGAARWWAGGSHAGLLAGAVTALLGGSLAMGLNVLGVTGRLGPAALAGLHIARFLGLLVLLGGIFFLNREIFVSFAGSFLAGVVIFMVVEIAVLSGGGLTGR